MEPDEPTGGTDGDVVDLAHRMFDLARAGGTAQLLDYVRAGVPVDLTDPKGNTLLMLAAYHGHAELVLGLAGLGADPDRVNDRGQTPLAGAVFKREPAVVRALMDAGADPDLGEPSALAAAHFFDSTDLLPILERRT